MFVVCLLVGLFLSDPGQNQSDTANSKNHPREYAGQTPNVSASHPATPTPTLEKEVTDKKSEAGNDPKRWLGMTESEWVMALLTAVYVALTGFYARVSHKTLTAIEKQGESSTLQFNQQLAEAKKAANAAELSAKAAKASAEAALLNTQTIMASERAWVFFELKTYGENVFQVLFTNHVELLPKSSSSISGGHGQMALLVISLIPRTTDPKPSSCIHEFFLQMNHGNILNIG